MQITLHPGAEHVELRLQGRIDATWAEHLGAAVEKTVRAGTHHLILNFAGVDYISSLGIRVLVLQYKLLRSVKGSLTITNASPFCRNILTTVGLSELLAVDTPQPAGTAQPAVSRQTRGGATYEIYPQSVSAPLSCTLIGNPEKLVTTGFDETDCRPLRFANGTFGLGLGAFGETYADCKGRFGDFLAAGGCAITLPTNDPHSLPDYLIEQGYLIPQVETLYALYGKGEFSTMVRFDSLSSGPGKIALSELLAALIDLSGNTAIAFAILAEAAGLVGATLRNSPAGKPLSHELPSVRDWLSFTTERASEKSLAMLVGVADRAAHRDLAKFLRPIKPDSALAAHVHAAVFPYRPVQRGELPFSRTVADLVNASSPTGLMHLMADTRPFEGVGETDLARGACWLGPLTSLAQDEAV